MADASFDERLDAARKALEQTNVVATDFLNALRKEPTSIIYDPLCRKR